MRALRASLAALLVLALGCSSFGQFAGTSRSSRLDRILQKGELRVGLTGDQPPLNMRSKSGSIIGLEVDMAEALAESMRLEVRLVPMPFADLLPALERGDVDLVISGVTITPARNARVAFAGPYFISGKSVLTTGRPRARPR